MPQNIELPSWLPRSVWCEFVKHRQEIGAGLTVRSARVNLGRLTTFVGQGHDPVKVVERTLASQKTDGYGKIVGWLGFFANEHTKRDRDKTYVTIDEPVEPSQGEVDKFVNKMSDIFG